MVETWIEPLACAPEELRRRYETLAGDERARAGRFAFPRLRDRFIAARGFLRLTMAAAVGAAPQDLEFEYGPHGKPALRGQGGPHFNLSHSGDWLAFALSRESPVGVDIEQFRHLGDMAGVAKRFFSDGEVAALFALPAKARERAFFEIWTRKEAFLKATGEGISRGLSTFAVSIGEPARLLWAAEGGDSRWALRSLAAPEGYACALCFCAKPDASSSV